MRIISQDGLIDAPYEMTAFCIVGGIIRMNMAGDMGKGTIIAHYSTQEKALKCLEQMRDVLYHTPERVFSFPLEDEI